MAKNVDFEVGFTDKGAKAGFDGIDVSAKELQSRIAQLDAVMEKLTAEFGKNAYVMKAGVIAQRERGVALNQLIALEEKEAVAVGRSTRGLGSLGSAALAVSGSISGLGTGVSVLTNALMSGVGLTAGLALAVSGFALLMEHLKGINSEMDKLKGQISGLLDIEGPGGKFKVDPRQLDSMIASLQKRIDLYNAAKATSEGTKGKFEFQDIRFQEALIKVLEKANLDYKQQQSTIESLKQEGYTFTETMTDGAKKASEAVEALNNAWQKVVVTIEDDLNKAMRDLEDTLLPDIMPKPVASDRSLGMRSGRYNLRGIEDEIKNMENKYQAEQDWIQRNADFFQSEFSTAWETVFGKADNLFTRYLAMWADQFANNLFNMDKGTPFLDLIPGFGFFSSLINLFSKPSVGGGNTVKLYIDGREMAQTNVNLNYKAQKLRLSPQ